MRLTARTDYALRMMIFLGLQYPEYTTIQEIAERYGISKNHLMKIANDLSNKGWIDSMRGRQGGIRLGRPAGEINIGKLVRATEDDTIVECFRAENACIITTACPLASVLQEGLKAFYGVLEKYTLVDLMDNRSKMKALLGLAVDAPTAELEPDEKKAPVAAE